MDTNKDFRVSPGLSRDLRRPEQLAQPYLGTEIVVERDFPMFKGSIENAYRGANGVLQRYFAETTIVCPTDQKLLAIFTICCLEVFYCKNESNFLLIPPH